jgi:hypothetical protein
MKSSSTKNYQNFLKIEPIQSAIVRTVDVSLEADISETFEEHFGDSLSWWLQFKMNEKFPIRGFINEKFRGK